MSVEISTNEIVLLLWECEQRRRNLTLKEIEKAEDGNELLDKARPKDLIDGDCSLVEVVFSQHEYYDWLRDLDYYKEVLKEQYHANQEAAFNETGEWLSDKTLDQHFIKVAEAYAIYWQTVVNNLRQQELKDE